MRNDIPSDAVETIHVCRDCGGKIWVVNPVSLVWQCDTCPFSVRVRGVGDRGNVECRYSQPFRCGGIAEYSFTVYFQIEFGVHKSFTDRLREGLARKIIEFRHPADKAEFFRCTYPPHWRNPLAIGGVPSSRWMHGEEDNVGKYPVEWLIQDGLIAEGQTV